MTLIKYPFGAGSALAITATGTTAATINDQLTYVSSITTLTGNATLDITAGAELKAGAVLHLIVKTTGTETFTFGTLIEAPVVTGVAGKTWSQTFIYNGTTFYPAGAKIQVD